MKKFSVELYFFNLQFLGSPLEKIPNLDKYLPETKLAQVSANDWDTARKVIIKQHPDVAYIHLIDSKSLDL
jgi:hypothetical protein